MEEGAVVKLISQFLHEHNFVNSLKELEKERSVILRYFQVYNLYASRWMQAIFTDWCVVFEVFLLGLLCCSGRVFVADDAIIQRSALQGILGKYTSWASPDTCAYSDLPSICVAHPFSNFYPAAEVNYCFTWLYY